MKDSELHNEVQNGLIMYKSLEFTFGLKTYIMSLLKCKLKCVVSEVEAFVLNEEIPVCVLMVAKDMMAYRFRNKITQNVEDTHTSNVKRCYVNVLYHNKGMDILDLPRILSLKKVEAAVPRYFRGSHPIVTYTGTHTCRRTSGMKCECS